MPQLVDAKRAAYVSCCSVKAPIPLPRVHTACWFWVVILSVLSSFGASSVEGTPRSEEGKCRYDLTSVAALSCEQTDADGVSRPPSRSCSNALLYAIDEIPASGVSGACCLCRYMKEKMRPPVLATAYIVCKGKDRDIIAKWSSFPITTCLAECGQGNSSSQGTEYEDSRFVQADSTGKRQELSTGTVIWVAVVVFIVIGLVCLWFFRRFKGAKTASESRAGRRRSVGTSSAKRKEKRFSSSRRVCIKFGRLVVSSLLLYSRPWLFCSELL